MRHEQRLQIAPVGEQVVHVAPCCGVPAVLGAETTDSAVHQSLVKLILQRSCPERKHILAANYPVSDSNHVGSKLFGFCGRRSL